MTLTRSDDCPFCFPGEGRLFLRNDLIGGLWDAFPVVPGHALLFTRRHVPDWFSASDDEHAALTEAIASTRVVIEELATHDGRSKPTGYNVGFNAGAAAGQTIFHLHIHVIPRYPGDHPDPRGGIRAVIPGKAVY